MRDRFAELIQLDSGACSVIAMEVVRLYLEDTGNTDLAKRLIGPINYRLAEIREQDPNG
jgi:hypothetical protein